MSHYSEIKEFIHFRFFTLGDSKFYFSFSFPCWIRFNLKGVYIFLNQQRRTAAVQKYGETAIIRNLQAPKLWSNIRQGWDIYISSHANSNTGSYTDFGGSGDYSVPSGVKNLYTILAGTRKFSPDEVEIFYLN